ncbi:MAG: hypothetical protein ACKPEA_05650 [Planctomycetota bacterium]
MSGPNPERVETPYLRGIPEPTSGPLWAGFGVTMVFAGLVTHWTVSLLGAVCAVAGFIAWAKSCFPEESLEALAKGSEVVEPAPALERKAPAHRVMLPESIHPYRSGVWGGLAGGIGMAVVAVAWGVLREGSVWLPINLLAGVFVPSVDAADTAALKAFQPGLFAIATGIHLVACVFIGLLYAVSLPMMPRRPLLLGGVLGPVLWTGMLYATIGIVNPALERYVSWPWFFVSQAAFGVVCGRVVSRSKRIPTMAGWSVAERMAVERGGEEGR